MVADRAQRVKFEKPGAGEWVKPRKRFYKMACCDCGLVHKMEFAIKPFPYGRGKAVYFRVWRDNRSTALMRHHHNIKVKHK